jgi:hypothetical protein
MAKIFLSLGFWMTIVLFIALGYALGYAHCAEDADSIGDQHPATARSVLPDENQRDANNIRAGDVVPRSRCPQSATPRSNIADFDQMANLQEGGPAYASGFSFSISRHPSQLTLCPGPIEIPRH